MIHNAQFTLSYTGNDSDNHEIDFYDVSEALVGFQRSLALTAHLVANGKIVTKAPYIKGAKIVAIPPQEGSWKLTAGVIFTGIYAVGTASNNTPIGHLAHSIYDYVVSESLGFHVDYDKSLGELYERAEQNKLKIPFIRQHQADSLIEKCSSSIASIHRPIYKNKTALSASIVSSIGEESFQLNSEFSQNSFDYMNEDFIHELPIVIKGRISSYNSNNFKGRIYVADEGRPITFDLSKNSRNEYSLKLIIASLSATTHQDYGDEWVEVYCRVLKHTSRSGLLKEYTITQLSHEKIR